MTTGPRTPPLFAAPAPAAGHAHLGAAGGAGRRLGAAGFVRGPHPPAMARPAGAATQPAERRRAQRRPGPAASAAAGHRPAPDHAPVRPVLADRQPERWRHGPAHGRGPLALPVGPGAAAARRCRMAFPHPARLWRPHAAGRRHHAAGRQPPHPPARRRCAHAAHHRRRRRAPAGRAAAQLHHHAARQPGHPGGRPAAGSGGAVATGAAALAATAPRPDGRALGQDGATARRLPAGADPAGADVQPRPGQQCRHGATRPHAGGQPGPCAEYAAVHPHQRRCGRHQRPGPAGAGAGRQRPPPGGLPPGPCPGQRRHPRHRAGLPGAAGDCRPAAHHGPPASGAGLRPGSARSTAALQGRGAGPVRNAGQPAGQRRQMGAQPGGGGLQRAGGRPVVHHRR